MVDRDREGRDTAADDRRREGYTTQDLRSRRDRADPDSVNQTARFIATMSMRDTPHGFEDDRGPLRHPLGGSRQEPANRRSPPPTGGTGLGRWAAGSGRDLFADTPHLVQPTLVHGGGTMFPLDDLEDEKHTEKWCKSVLTLDGSNSVLSQRKWFTQDAWNGLDDLARIYPEIWGNFEQWTIKQFVETLDEQIVNVRDDRYALTLKDLFHNTVCEFNLENLTAVKLRGALKHIYEKIRKYQTAIIMAETVKADWKELSNIMLTVLEKGRYSATAGHKNPDQRPLAGAYNRQRAVEEIRARIKAERITTARAILDNFVTIVMDMVESFKLNEDPYVELAKAQGASSKQVRSEPAQPSAKKQRTDGQRCGHCGNFHPGKVCNLLRPQGGMQTHYQSAPRGVQQFSGGGNLGQKLNAAVQGAGSGRGTPGGAPKAREVTRSTARPSHYTGSATTRPNDGNAAMRALIAIPGVQEAVQAAAHTLDKATKKHLKRIRQKEARAAAKAEMNA